MQGWQNGFQSGGGGGGGHGTLKNALEWVKQ